MSESPAAPASADLPLTIAGPAGRIEAAFDLPEAIKRQGSALNRYLNVSLLSAHLEESVRICLSRRDRLRELAHFHLREQFYRLMQNREATHDWWRSERTRAGST